MKNPLRKLRRKGAPAETPWEEIAKKVRAFSAYRFIKGKRKLIVVLRKSADPAAADSQA